MNLPPKMYKREMVEIVIRVTEQWNGVKRKCLNNERVKMRKTVVSPYFECCSGIYGTFCWNDLVQ